jgi:hypothetical protein
MAPRVGVPESREPTELGSVAATAPKGLKTGLVAYSAKIDERFVRQRRDTDPTKVKTCLDCHRLCVPIRVFMRGFTSGSKSRDGDLGRKSFVLDNSLQFLEVVVFVVKEETMCRRQRRRSEGIGVSEEAYRSTPRTTDVEL